MHSSYTSRWHDVLRATRCLLLQGSVDKRTAVEHASKGWPKACACGETWRRDHWGELTPVGRYRAAEDWLELRSCVCGRTLVVTSSELDGGGPAIGESPTGN